MSLNLLYHKFQILQNFLCILHNFFHFSRFFIIKTAHLHDFRYNLHCYFCFILTIFVFYFLYTIYKKSQSLFTEKILGFHFYIKVIQFFKNVFFFSLSKISNYLFFKQILSILFDHILIPIKTIFLISI